MPDNRWGDATLVARAPQSAPPGLALLDGVPMLSWVGVDARGVHHDARLLGGETVTLPLPPRQPREQQLIAGAGDSTHLFWLDADEAGVTQLFSALLDSELQVERGPTQISNALVLDYALAEDASGGVFVAYSGGQPGEPGMILSGVDTQGRPLPVTDRVGAAELPTFLWVDGDLRLYWVNREIGMIEGGVLQAGQVRNVELLVPTPYLATGDRMIDLHVGAERTHQYLFWNVERASGVFEAWYTFAALSDGTWTSWAQVGSRAGAGSVGQTGYNSGSLQLTPTDAAPLHMVAPLPQQGESLPVLGARGGQLIMMYFQAGEVIGEQTLWGEVVLVAPPLLSSDSARNLFATWSQVSADGSADLYVLSSLSRR